MTHELIPAPLPFRRAVQVWLKVGLISFGGPAAQIAILHEELVARRGWVKAQDFNLALNFCMLLPGPEAQQLATYLGWKLHGLRGALAAGVLFVVPGALVLFGLAWLAAAHGDWPPLRGAFRGMLPIVVALVAHAVWRIGGRTLKTPAAWVLAMAAFIGLGVMGIGFPWIIAAALIIGYGAERLDRPVAPPSHPMSEPASFSPRKPLGIRTVLYTIVFGGLWLVPVAAVLHFAGTRPFGDVAIFFTQAAFVTFGGAYAVLPFVAQGAVAHYGWLSRPEMIHGLALAETTPGPLILVTQYVGFFAGWNAALAGHAGGLSPLAAGAVAAALTTWVTFLPCFFFVLVGAPFVERLAQAKWAHAALSGVTAAVVGVIATLALAIAREAFLPNARPDGIAAIVAIIAFVALWRFKVGPLWLVAAGAVYGIGRFVVLQA